MPYMMVGNCVHKQNADKSAGEKLHCYDNPDDAKRYMRALYAHVKDSAVVSFSMRIEKASLDKGEQVMRWRAVASDTDPDLYDECMSTELYNDFVDRIKNNTPVPENFKSVICEDSWCGGIPYVSLAHYKSGTDKKNVPGEIEEVFMDGKYLKSKGTLNKNPLGYAVFDSLNKDLYKKKSDGTPEVPPEERIRISIGFLDLQHKHLLDDGTEKVFDRTDLNQVCQLCSSGIGRKIYTKGQLVHEALTRVPVNPRTSMEVDKSMNITTKKDDAASIIGKDLVEELEAKSLADGVLVVKADGTTEPQPMDIPDDMDKCYDPDTGGYDQECIDNLMMGNHLPAWRKDMKRELEKSDTVSKSVTKAESWGNEPSSSYLVVGDPEKSTSWHLPVKKHGKIDTGLMGAAHAALTSNHRGKAYAGPNKAKALAKLRSLYNSQGVDFEKEEKALRAMTEDALGKFMEESMADVKGLMKTTKTPPVDISITDADDRFEDTDILQNDASDEDMGLKKKKGSGNINAGKSKASMKESDENETDAEDAKEGKKGEKAEEKALYSELSKLGRAVVTLKSRGIHGKAAEDALAPILNEVAGVIEASLVPDGSAGYTPEDLASIMRSTVEDVFAPMEARLANIEKQLHANPTGGPTQNTPQARSLRFSMTQRSDVVTPNQPMKKLSQIEQIARRSTGKL